MKNTKTKAAPLISFDRSNYNSICDELAKTDKDLRGIIADHGYPPMWTRNNSLETIVRIILEQQVSLASALAALNKLKEKTGKITPAALLKLSDEEMRACYVSRQKMGYIRGVSQTIVDKELNLKKLEALSSDEIRETLIRLKGIGHWTIDVYLMFVLQRIDILPIGDLAIVNAVKKLKNLPATATKEDILKISERWQPYRTVASMLLWHYYLSNSKTKAPV